jgi:hypothetical protein
MVVNENEKSFSTIAEMPTRILPVLVDVDIKKKQDIPAIEKLYTEHHLATVIEVYQTVLKNILDNPSDKQFCCFVLEKEPYLDTNDSGVTYLKNGFHLHFPWIFMTNSDHEIHLTPRIKDAIKRTNVFKDIGFDNSAELIDACIRGFGAGAGNAPLELILPVLEKTGYTTGISFEETIKEADRVMDYLVPTSPITTPINILTGLTRLFSGFEKPIVKASKLYGIEYSSLIFELGNRKLVAGQEDLILEVAQKLKENK